jgi:hypothetical protein
MLGQEVRATILPAGQDRRPIAVLRLPDGLTVGLEAALLTYEVIEATPEERKTLHRCGHPFGGVQ